MDDETHEALLAEMSAGTLAEAEIVQRVGAYAGNATGRQLHELAKAAHIYSQDGRGPVRSAVGALLGNVNVGRQGRKID